MNVEVTYQIPNTTAQGKAVLPVSFNQPERYRLASQLDEAIKHLVVMINLCKQQEQRITELEAQLAKVEA